MTIFFISIAIALYIAYELFYKKSSGFNSKKVFDDFQYTKKQSVMNRSEAAFFFELKKQLPENYFIFPKMRIADIIDTTNGKGFYLRRNKILPKHIDFLICDSYFKPIVAIEVNGGSHMRQDRVERDSLVKHIFENAKMPLEVVNVGTDFINSIEKIKAKLK